VNPQETTDRQRYISQLSKGAESLGISLDNRAIELFTIYLDELTKWGKKMNLTGPATEKELVSRHFLDSLTLLPTLRALKVSSLLDIGSGAGFPGLPLKIAEPSLEVTLMDSREKRVFFLRHIIRTLGFSTGISAIKARAEVIPTRFKSNFECVTARAFASLGQFIPIALPYLKSGGFIIAMKGPSGPDELKDLETTGISAPRIETISLLGEDREALLMIFEKIS